LQAIFIPLPPLAEQRAIAEVLGALDDKIEANRKTTLVAEALVTAAFRYAMAQIGDRDVPLFDVVDFIFGEPFKSTEFNSAGIGRPLIRIRDLKTFSPQFWTTEARPRETVVEPGDIVVGMDAEFRPTLWQGMAGLLNQRVCMALPRGFGGRAFIRELLVEPLAEIESFKTGTTVSHLNKSDLEAVKVSVPESTAVARFDALAEPLRETIVALHRENMRLSSLRSTLLPKLLSGELRVRDAESIVGEAV
jgi:type I restriction enzyme S subunit